ncbi:hypothetical protein GOBAR_AA12831 [Gossypium barbadense]|uniref:3'(2'),5'-bisphosphate nucleotidase n=1 Tax=Gossypium barbadense TaxID=3634 RepID=A0A2P5XWW7_GOSBA|nr:hypothetical protein GOBAR_AA12831 [Gossypium barbadense]
MAWILEELCEEEKLTVVVLIYSSCFAINQVGASIYEYQNQSFLHRSSSFFLHGGNESLYASKLHADTDKKPSPEENHLNGKSFISSQRWCPGIVEHITELVNDSLTSDGSYNVTLSTKDVLKAIDNGISKGGCQEVGCLFFAKVGGGTYMQPLDSSSAVKVQVSAVENPEEASFFESYEAAHSMHDLSSLIAQKLGVKALPVRIDSQAKYGALSRGDGAIYLRFPHKGYREKIWDHATGCIVVTEAGGVVTDAAGQPLDFSKGKHLDVDTGIIVTNQKLMPLLLNAVKESLKEKAPSS